jgi:2-C-methyl-D-erythritol 4-phosphate cytidylyltransferase
MHTKLIAIVPAAGVGARAQGDSSSAILPKQYRLLRGKPMLRWAVEALLADSRIAQVRVAVAPDDIWVAQALAGLPRTAWRPCGGPTRADTVTAALRDAALGRDDWVLVHDAARPGLPASALARLIDLCLQKSVGGLLAQPVADTVKRSAGDDTVACSVSRSQLWLAQTPQMFPAGALLQALEAATAAAAEITDEASAMELAGHAPYLVAGSVRNFKVTWPEDFDLMDKWL